MEKELIILAVYINVDGLTRQEAEENLNIIKEEFKSYYYDYPNVKIHYIPVKNQDSKMECIYPIK